MKLSKAQRLFMKAGEINEKMSYYKLIFKATKAPGFPSHIRQLRSRRKRLIREALEAWRDTELDTFIAGYNACQNDEIL